MTAEGLLEIIAGGETSTVQFKRQLDSMDGIAAEMIAMSNAKGGDIVFGVDDKTGEIVGLDYVQLQDIGNRLATIASDMVKPQVFVTTEVVAIPIENTLRRLLVATVSEGTAKPYKDKTGVIWIKQGGDKRRLTDNSEQIRLFQQSGLLFVDEMIVPETSVSDIDKDKVQEYLQRINGDTLDLDIDKEQIYRNIGILKDDRLSLAGLLFFGKHPQRYRPAFCIKAVAFSIPSRPRRCGRYARPERETLLAVRDWYGSLEIRRDRREWLVVTLMLEFAMRNGDVERLRWSDFRPRDGAIVLCYTPHKTSLSSGRRVAWPVHPDIWARLCVYREEGQHHYKRRGWTKLEDRNAPLVVPCAKDVFTRLNADLRSSKIFTGSKGCYELRKICIDHVYQKFGAEMASSISGDDIRTMMRYYADPSQPNIGDLRIIDLL